MELVRICPTCGYCYGKAAASCPRDAAALLDRALLPRDVAGRYRLLRTLGSGGMRAISA